MLEVNRLHSAYSPSSEPILRNVSFKAAPGSITGILGPNGSGKSTLLLTLSGILKPREGKMLWKDKDLASLKQRQKALIMAAVPQKRGDLPSMEVFPFVLMGRYAKSSRIAGYNSVDKEKALKALEDVDAARFTGAEINKLSGGELQRVFVARALAQEAPILLLDEPSSSLDPGHGAALFNLLSRLCKQRDICVLAAMHDVNLASLYCQQLLLLDKGSIVACGTPDEVIKKHTLEEIYQTQVSIIDHPESRSGGKDKKTPQLLPAAPKSTATP